MNCLDAETLAAWFDGGLSGAALEEVQSHVAMCGRCQALLGAMGRTRAAVPAPQPERNPRWWLAWTVPAAAAATALVIWIAVPRQTNVAVNPSPSAELQKQEASPQSTLPPAPPQAETAAPAAAPATPARQTRAKAGVAPPAATPQAANAANDALQQAPAELNEAVTVRSAAAPPAASPPAAAERREEAERPGAAAGQRQLQPRAAFATTLCGPMWPAPPSEVAAQVTAGSSPSTAVCWIVGRAGTVLRSTDQRTWQRLTFPLTVDVTSVTATDAQSASVVTADGRTFSTVDGGVTWIQR